MNRRDLILGGATLAAASPILAPTARAAWPTATSMRPSSPSANTRSSTARAVL